ncbi:MAG: prefoldin subunit alpha [Candidatus Aenigmarchaeota archaeon]|nr:prefoldin subunit alpha [Candidatus Aenigmarchaeota archaeon]
MPKKQASKKAGEDDKELQKKYLMLQILKQQLSALLEEKNALNEKVAEIATTIQALEKLADVKKGEEMWSSLGSGAFARSDIKDTENVLVAVGAGVVVKETKERGIEILKLRLDHLQKLDAELVAEINKFGEQAANVEEELQHAVANR